MMIIAEMDDDLFCSYSSNKMKSLWGQAPLRGRLETPPRDTSQNDLHLPPSIPSTSEKAKA